MVLISKSGIIGRFLLFTLLFFSLNLISAQSIPINKSASQTKVLASSSVLSAELAAVSKPLAVEESQKNTLASTHSKQQTEFNLNNNTEINVSNSLKTEENYSLSKLTMGLLTAAKKSIEKGEYEVAEEAYRQTLLQSDISSNSTRIQKISLQLARLLKRMKQYEEAMAIYASLELKTHKPEVHLEYIRILHDSGASQKALTNCKVLLQNHPDFLKAELTAGMITKSNGDYVNSLLHFDRYLALRPEDPLALLETGNLLEKMKQWKQAKMLYDKLLQLQPENRQALRNRGNTLVHLEEYELAVKDLTSSGMQTIPWVERLLRYAKGQIDIARAKKNKEMQAVAAAKLIETKSEKTITIRTSQDSTEQEVISTTPALSNSQSKTEMIAKLNQINFVEFSPEDTRINELADPQIKDEISSPSAEEIPQKSSPDKIATTQENNLSSSTEKTISSTEALATDHSRDKEKSKLEELSIGFKHSETALKALQPKNSPSNKTKKKPAREQDAVLPTKGMELVENRNYQRALPILRLEVKRYPQNRAISNSLRVALQSMSLFDDILRELNRILVHHPNDYKTQLTRSFYLLESGEIEAALETTLPETDPYALYIRATAMKKLGRFKDAQVLQKRLENLDQRFIDHQTGRFLWLVKLKDYLFAYPLGKKLIQANRPWLSFPMAVVSRALDYPVEAVLYLTQTVQDDPKNARAYFELSQIMDQLDRPEDRDIFLQKALSIEPSNDQYKSYHQQLALKNP